MTKKQHYTTDEGISAIIALQGHVGCSEHEERARSGWLSMTHRQQLETMAMYETMKAEGYFDVATSLEQATELLEKYKHAIKVQCKSAKRDVATVEQAKKFFEYMAAAPPTTEEIMTYFNCKGCVASKPAGQSMREWARLNVGWTPHGFQVWCVRCDKNIIHVDFGGMKVAGAV